MDVVGTLMKQLSGDTVAQIGRQIGADPATTQRAISAALPALVSAMARNAAKPGGAEALGRALERDHDGSILDNVMGALGGGTTGAGAGILKHVLGGQRGAVEGSLAKGLGLGGASMSRLLEVLAPLVMGALGKARAQGGLDAGALGALLGREREAASAASPDVMGMLGGLLDADKDGSVVDDIAGIAGKLFGGR